MTALEELLLANGLDQLGPQLIDDEELTLAHLLMMNDLAGCLAELGLADADASRVVRAVRGTSVAASAPDAAAVAEGTPAHTGASGSATSGVPPACSLRAVRVAVVGHSGYFAGDSYGGATRASLALIRELKRLCGSASVDILALVAKPCPEGLVYKLTPPWGGSGATGAEPAGSTAAAGPLLGLCQWEGHDVLIGEQSDLVSALRGRGYTAVLSLSIEAPLLQLSCALDAVSRYAMAHNYYLPPFGPFRRHEPQAGHAALLQHMDCILSPCEHHCRYLERWGPADPPLRTAPLWAADYHYFHQRRATQCNGGAGADAAAMEPGTGADALSLPRPMRPWEAQHRFVTMVSPCPAKGLSILLALARRMPDVAFAAVPTGWTDARSREQLARYTNITILPANDDVDVIFGQTRVLLAPSLWQECCPLVVMEALLRAIPCVSSDVLGMPEANLNHTLVCATRLSFDHARGALLHGVCNAQLERELGPDPPIPDARQRAANLALAVQQEATEEEVAPFERALRLLLSDETHLRRQSEVCREAFSAFARQCEGGVARLLNRPTGRGATSLAPALCEGGTGGVGRGAGSYGTVGNGAAVAVANGARLVRVSLADLKPQLASHEESVAAASAQGAREFRVAARYRVVFKPLVYLRVAPSTRSAIITIAPSGTLIEADATLETAEGTWVRTKRPVAVEPVQRRGWALVHGTVVGLGTLLRLESEGIYENDLRG